MNLLLISQLFQGPGTTGVVFRSGIGLGSVLACICSWQRNRSILFAFLAGIFSWLYVIYFALTRREDERK